MDFHPPLPEEYSRVTDAERFRPIEIQVRRDIDMLLRNYEVEVRETEVPVSGIDPKLVVQSFLVLPKSPDAASIHVSITTFPGVRVKFGVGTTLNFPACGCDACRETAEGEIERFEFLLYNAVAGRFSERVCGLLRKKFETCSWSEAGSQRGSEVLSKNDPRQNLRRQDFHWQPWPTRRIG